MKKVQFMNDEDLLLESSLDKMLSRVSSSTELYRPYFEKDTEHDSTFDDSQNDEIYIFTLPSSSIVSNLSNNDIENFGDNDHYHRSIIDAPREYENLASGSLSGSVHVLGSTSIKIISDGISNAAVKPHKIMNSKEKKKSPKTLEKNRLAARVARQKKKKKDRELTLEVEFLRNENLYLQKQLMAKEKKKDIKTELEELALRLCFPSSN